MSIEAITSRIANEAAEHERRLIEEAQAEAKAEAIRRHMREKAAEETPVIIRKKHAAAELEARKMRLAVKQQVIDRALDRASQLLADMDPEGYIELLARHVVKIGLGEGTVFLNEKDREALGERFVLSANKALEKAGGKGLLALSDESIDIRGGFVIRQEVMDVHCTLETMVEGIKDAAMTELLEVLFEE